jgi:predicted transcriptional regulator
MIMLRKCVRAVIRENRPLTVREVSEEVGITKRSCHTILTETQEMHRVAAKSVPRLLTDEQKGANRVRISLELFDRSNADENVLKNVIRCDET